MIDFANGSFVKLSPVDPREVGQGVAQLLVPGENVLQAFKAMRDYVVFTDKRLMRRPPAAAPSPRSMCKG